VDEKKAALIRAHENNIDRYQRLLKTKLSEHEVQYLGRRLAEERFTIKMLEFMSPQSMPVSRPVFKNLSTKGGSSSNS
jgi:hypothetical protein